MFVFGLHLERFSNARDVGAHWQEGTMEHVEPQPTFRANLSASALEMEAVNKHLVRFAFARLEGLPLLPSVPDDWCLAPGRWTEDGPSPISGISLV
jgi:hypothetical protein